MTIKATGEETNDSFYLGEAVFEPGFPGPPPHRHHRLHDMFYILDGTLTVRLGDETVELEPGSFVCVPLASSTPSATQVTPRSGS